MVFLHEPRCRHGAGGAHLQDLWRRCRAGDDGEPRTGWRAISAAIGFKTADAIAMKLGIEKTALIRVRAGISFALVEAMDEGHCGLPTDELIPLAEELLEVPPELIRTALDLELSEGTVIADHVGETRLRVSGGPVPSRARYRRPARAALERQAALAPDRSGQGAPVGRAAHRFDSLPKARRTQSAWR